MSKTQFVQITRQSKIAETEFIAVTGSMYKQIWEELSPPQILTHDLSDRRAGNIVTPVDAPIPDCQTCGACCIGLPQVAVYPDEHEQVSPENYWEITIKGEKDEITVDRFLRRDGETFACAALRGKPGEQVSCGIYEQRPIVCHNFDAGSDKCHALRRAFGFEPNLSLMDMYYAVQKLKAIPDPLPSNEEILCVNFIEQPETGYLEVKATMTDRSTQIIHTFDPNEEPWHQYEFKGLSLEFVKNMINSRQQNKPDLI